MMSPGGHLDACSYADKEVATSDLFQSFVYAQAVSGFGEAPTAYILYAADRDAPPRTVALHRGDGNAAARVTYMAVNVPEVLRSVAARPALFAQLREVTAMASHAGTPFTGSPSAW